MLELLKQRRTIRKYKDTKIPQNILDELLASALTAPSGLNKKPVEFIVVDNKEILHKLAECKNMGTLGFHTAPLAIVVTADAIKSDTWVEDASIASTIIQLSAQHLGLGSCWIQMRNRQCATGNSEKAIADLLNIPENFGVLSVLTIGYPAEEKEAYNDSDLDFTKVHYNSF